MAILIASTLLETETEAWYSFYVDTMEDVKGLPTSKSTGSSYKVKKFAKPASQASEPFRPHLRSAGLQPD